MPRYFYSVRVKLPEAGDLEGNRKFTSDSAKFREGFGCAEGRFYYGPAERHSQNIAKRRAMKLAEVWGIKLDCTFDVREMIEL